MPLTDIQIKSLKPAKKPFKKFDGGGLYINVTPTGSKLWRFKYKFNGLSKILSMGKYPLIGLKDARLKHQEAKKLLLEGIDPSLAKKEKKTSHLNTFEKVAAEWFDNEKDRWTSGHAELTWRRIEMNLLPSLKNIPINKITTRNILTALRKVESRGALEVARRTAQITNNIFIYAVANYPDHIKNNPAGSLVKALKVPPKKHLAAITNPTDVGELLRAIDEFHGTFTVACALKILPYVFLRPGELRKGEWSEIDFANCLCSIPADRMKIKREQLVPLSNQVIGILKLLKPLTGHGKYIFPAVHTTSRPMSENTLNVALRRLGYSKEQMCSHGFRTTASTNLHEMGWKSEVVERQLAHLDRNAVRGTYNKAKYLEERTKMMQSWADTLDSWKAGGKIIPFKKAL